MEQSTDGYKVLSDRTIAIGAVIVVVTTLGVMAVLIGVFWGEPADVVLNVIRTSASLGAGTGGGVALWLAARRQRATEIGVKQKEHDATETRVTEMYGKAADQLGSEKAPVRLAGILALERLAQAHPAHRQTIVDLMCAYLRMPEPGDAEAQELEVRQTAQGVLGAHLRVDGVEGTDSPGRSELFWPDLTVNVSGATLRSFRLTNGVVRSATFSDARFAGPTVFRGARFDQHADFRNVRFTGLADFRRVTFGGEGVNFRGARFEGEVDFGTHTTATLTGAVTRTDPGTRRKWPAGWVEAPLLTEPGWAKIEREMRS